MTRMRRYEHPGFISKKSLKLELHGSTPMRDMKSLMMRGRLECRVRDTVILTSSKLGDSTICMFLGLNNTMLTAHHNTWSWRLGRHRQRRCSVGGRCRRRAGRGLPRRGPDG
jgi:hypothetical protein